MSKVALIYGITGQTGSYLAEHLVSLGYIVHGVIRRTSNFNTIRLNNIFERIRDNLHYGDIIDPLSVIQIIKDVQPHEIYNLAAQSHVKVSFDMPLYTTQVDALGTLNVLEAIRINGLENVTKFYQANTSEMYGGHKSDYSKEVWKEIEDKGMNENTPFFPKSPYGIAKLYSHHIVDVYRQSYNIYAVSGICFNHESERRDPRFVTRKVTSTVAKIACGKEHKLVLGNLDAERDWGHARDYVVAMHKSLQLDDPLDFVIATGKTYTVRYLVEVAFNSIGIIIQWEGESSRTVGRNLRTGDILVTIDDKYYRPNEVHYLKGDASRAKQILNWSPTTDFITMIDNMVRYDIKNEQEVHNNN